MLLILKNYAQLLTSCASHSMVRKHGPPFQYQISATYIFSTNTAHKILVHMLDNGAEQKQKLNFNR